MPQCCIVQCSSRKNKNQPQLTFHRMPRNDIKRNKWLEIIGIEKINPRHKDWYICSLHFEESSFNRTLDVIRLRDDAVPLTSLLVTNKQELSVLSEYKTDDNLQKAHSAPIMSPLMNVEMDIKEMRDKEQIKKLAVICNKQRSKIKRLNEQVRRRNKKIALLKDIIEDLKKTNKINNEQSLLLEECAGPEDFLKRYIAKSRELRNK